MKFKTIIGIVTAIGLFSTSSSYAFRFKPTVSFIGSYTHFQDYSQVSAGIFDIENRNANFGFEFTHKFYVGNQYFLKTGLRYKHYKKVVTSKNQVPEIFDYPASFLWERRYEGVNVPILIGKDFITKNGRKGDFYIGFSPGILMNSYRSGALQGGFIKSADFAPYRRVKRLWDSTATNPSFFFPLLDVGINYSPIKQLPGFSIGLMCSAQLNKAQYSNHHASFKVLEKGYDFPYEMYTSNRVINASLVLSYTFGSGKSDRSKQNSDGMECPTF